MSRYINRGSVVFGCFLDASKAFDLVVHELLFEKLIDRCLPSPCKTGQCPLCRVICCVH